MVTPKPNGIFEDSIGWYCRPCQRPFVSEQAINAHCRNAALHYGRWCDRCKWLFSSQNAMTLHIQYSTSHHFCLRCDIELLSSADYEDHLESEHFYCRRCQSFIAEGRGPGGRANDDSLALLRAHRVSEHFMCPTCDTYFENQNNVDQHQRVHLPHDKECYGCSRKFPSLSAMMIHLESRTCSSQTTINNIDSWASPYFFATPNQYDCPRCQHQFSYLSGLLQHLESNACGATVESDFSALPTYLASKISQLEWNRKPLIAYVGGITVRV